MYRSIYPSDLYCKIIKIYHIGDKHVSCKLQFFYKTNNEECMWLPRKNYKIIRSVYDNWEYYEYK